MGRAVAAGRGSGECLHRRMGVRLPGGEALTCASSAEGRAVAGLRGREPRYAIHEMGWGWVTRCPTVLALGRDARWPPMPGVMGGG